MHKVTLLLGDSQFESEVEDTIIDHCLYKGYKSPYIIIDSNFFANYRSLGYDEDYRIFRVRDVDIVLFKRDIAKATMDCLRFCHALMCLGDEVFAVRLEDTIIQRDEVRSCLSFLYAHDILFEKRDVRFLRMIHEYLS